MVNTRRIVRRHRREAVIGDGLRVVLQWLEQQRREYMQKMRKTWYYIYRRFRQFTGDRPLFNKYMLPAFGQEMAMGRMQYQRRRYLDWPTEFALFKDVEGEDYWQPQYYYPGL